jgi:hypothetical protein
MFYWKIVSSLNNIIRNALESLRRKLVKRMSAQVLKKDPIREILQALLIIIFDSFLIIMYHLIV